MKNTLLILCFLFSIKSIACACLNSSSVHEKFIISDVVAKVKILKTYKNVDSYDYYKADVLVKKTYKGKTSELKSIYILGENDGELQGYISNCQNLFIPKDTELLIYTSKNKDGRYILNRCSGYMHLSPKNWQRKGLKLELKIVKKLKQKKITFTNKGDVVLARTLNNFLKKFNNIKLRKQFAIFEVDFNKPLGSEFYDVKLETIKVICGFNKKLDAQLINLIKKEKWQSRMEEGESGKKLLIIKYTKAIDNEPSYLYHDIL